MESANRAAWIHVPKAGTSFGAVVARYLMPSLPSDAVMPSIQVGSPGADFIRRYPLPAGSYWEKYGNWADHTAIDDLAWDAWRGDFVGLFRDPIRRAMAGP